MSDTTKLPKWIITFGTAHLKGIHPFPNKVMLVIEAETHEMARKMVFDSVIGDKFFTSYPYKEHVDEFKDKYGMVEYTLDELLQKD